jgi:hypothetical protein
MEGKCALCSQQVKTGEEWIRAQLRTGCAVFHWACFIGLMKHHGETVTGQERRKEKPPAEAAIER